MSEDSKFFLKDSDVPKQWYNLGADLKEPMSPPLNPGTKQPIGPDDLAPLFPMELIMQEVTQERYIDIPGPVLEAYSRWRSTPLVRARALEKALDTPARIYYKYEGASPSGSHKPNTALAQAFYNKEAGVKKIATETGAGQWGTALSYAGAVFGIEQFMGAYVKDPQVGMHEWVMSFDLNSLYPHLIMQYNISPETFTGMTSDTTNVDMMLRKEVKTNKLFAQTPNGAKFSKRKQGFLPEILENLYDERVLWKRKMIEHQREFEKTDDPRRKQELNRKIAIAYNNQMVRKISLNSAYGAIGNEWFRYFEIGLAEAVTSSGQLAIKWVEFDPFNGKLTTTCHCLCKTNFKIPKPLITNCTISTVQRNFTNHLVVICNCNLSVQFLFSSRVICLFKFSLVFNHLSLPQHPFIIQVF